MNHATRTATLRRVWAFTSEYQQRNGYGPIVREVALACHGRDSRNWGWRWIKELEATGYVTHEGRGYRTWRVNVPLITRTRMGGK